MNRKGRISMDKSIQVIRMRQAGHSINRIGESLKMCKKTVKRILEDRSLEKPLPDMVSPCHLPNEPNGPKWLQELDCDALIKQIQKGVSYQILYQEQKGISVGYWSFWNALSRLVKATKAPPTTMRLKHVPGEKAFVDYTDGIDIYDLNTGEVVSTELFVGTLPFSSYVYAEFTFSQKLFEFIESHERMWKYFGGVTSYTVTDNLKSSVNRAHLYDPDKNKTFTAYANHAGFAVLPARSNRPKDKANVECHAGLIQRTFYQEVRNRSFYSVPHRYVGQKVRVIGTFSKIAIYDLKTLEKIASHSTSRKNGERCTDELHWPP